MRLIFIHIESKGMKMLRKYKVKLKRKFEFELDGSSKEDVKEQVNYIMSETKILEMPYVKKKTKMSIRKVNKKWELIDEKNN